MKHSLNDLIGYPIEALDGPKGKVKDFLFDEEKWVIRYAETDFSKFFNKKRVLIPGLFLKKPERGKMELPVNLTRTDIEACPDPEERKPVSRTYEAQINAYYSIDDYWRYDLGTIGSQMIYPPRPIRIPAVAVGEDDADTSLRSFKEVMGYHIDALDGTLGHIEDLIVDDEDWQVVYIVANTSNWLPWSKKVILPLDFLEKISFIYQQVSIELKKEDIREAPVYDSEKSLDLETEKNIYEFLAAILMRNRKESK